MKHAENTRRLLHAMSGFGAAYSNLVNEINDYEQKTGRSVNNLKGFTESYPFDKSFDELAINQWVSDTIEDVRRGAYKVLNYEYLNTGGNCMVGVFQVWLPCENRTEFVFVNEEGATRSVVDYISNEIDVDDYDKLIIENIDWGTITGNEQYFELYRHCLNEYTKSDCRYFKCDRGIPYYLLSDELQSMVPADYLVWCEENNNGLVDTDGVKIIENLLYSTPDPLEEHLQLIKDWKRWHDGLVNRETTDQELDTLYDKDYELCFGGKVIKLPFNADTFNNINDLLDSVIKEW